MRCNGAGCGTSTINAMPDSWYDVATLINHRFQKHLRFLGEPVLVAPDDDPSSDIESSWHIKRSPPTHKQIWSVWTSTAACFAFPPPQNVSMIPQNFGWGTTSAPGFRAIGTNWKVGSKTDPLPLSFWDSRVKDGGALQLLFHIWSLLLDRLNRDLRDLSVILIISILSYAFDTRNGLWTLGFVKVSSSASAGEGGDNEALPMDRFRWKGAIRYFSSSLRDADGMEEFDFCPEERSRRKLRRMFNAWAWFDHATFQE
jgi:hypothetical protein